MSIRPRDAGKIWKPILIIPIQSSTESSDWHNLAT